MKTPSPGPWTVVFPEESGSKGERFGIVKDAEGNTIAAVYPAPNSAANANVIAAVWDLIDLLKVARAVVADNLEVLERSYLPEPNDAEAEELTEHRDLLEGIDAVIAKAEGRA